MPEARAVTCAICGQEDREPMMADGYYPDLSYHVACLHTAEGLRWRESRQRSDPGYARYWTLVMVGRSVSCPECGQEMKLSAKARGFAAGSWEVSCDCCYRITRLNDYQDEKTYQRLGELEDEFLRHGSAPELESLAKGVDPRLGKCRCGGSFSLAARPRCSSCAAVLLDSAFHYAYPG